MYTLPGPSTATDAGLFNAAAVAGPPFPDEPAVPDPAIVLMVPSGRILRTRLFRESAMKMLLPWAVTPRGALRAAAVAAPPSPEKPVVPEPAMVLMMPLVDTRRMRSL